MFIRRVAYRIKPEFDTKEGIKKAIEDAVRVPFQAVEGLMSSNFMPSITRGEYQVISVYQTESDAKAVTDKVDETWAKVADKLQGPIELVRYGAHLRD